MNHIIGHDFYQRVSEASPGQLAFWYIPIVLTCILLPLTFVSIELFHTLIELVAIGIAFMSFVVAWNTFSLLRNRFSLILGIGYFWVGAVDLFHTLSFKQVVDIGPLQAGATIEFWIAGRLLEALVLLFAPVLLVKNVRPKYLFYACGIYVITAFVMIYSERFPAMIRPGEGLTEVKIFSEYAIIVLLMLASAVFHYYREQFETATRQLIYLSIAFTIFAELSFTLYVGFDDAALVVGHVFKLLSFWLIYRLLIESALLKPISSLDKVVRSYDSVDEQTVIIDQNGYVQYANTAVRDRSNQALVGAHCHEVLHDPSVSRNQCAVCLRMEKEDTFRGLEFFSKHDHQWYEANLANIMMSGESRALIHSIRKITSRKHNEQQVLRLSRLYQVLSEANKTFPHIKDLRALFQKVCDIGIEQGRFKMVWIGIVDGNIVKPEFYAGKETGYLKEMQMRVDDSEWAKGPVGLAAKTKRVSFVNNVATDPDFWPWRDAAMQRGYGSLAAVPIVSDGEVLGIFTLYSGQTDIFDAQMITVLENLSRDLSSAIYHLEQEKQRLEQAAIINKLSQAVAQSVNGILIADLSGRVEYINSQFTVLTGFREGDVLGKQLIQLAKSFLENNDFSHVLDSLSRNESWQGEMACLRQDGSRYQALVSISQIETDGKASHFVVSGIDHTELFEAQETIKQLAFYDVLTGLANRRLLMDRLQHALVVAEKHDELVAVMLCDLDNFKTINDSMGHDAGDELLKKVAADLTTNTRENDTVARMGGDEFVVVLEGLKDIESVLPVAHAMFDAFREPAVIKGTQVSTGSSMGVALFPQDGRSPDELLRNADLAMYHAKGKGKSRFHFYQADMNDAVQRRLDLEQKLRQAIEQSDFHLVYQAQVEIETGNITGFEALIRWQDGDELISPVEFIPLAEESGLIVELGDWVIKKAIEDWHELCQICQVPVSMAVNVSARQFEKNSRLYDTLKLALSESKQSPERFTVEITEGTLIGDIDHTTSTLNQLKELGLMISVDDFGTGYSSLSYLKRFPLDQLKIDRSFVEDLLNDENDQAIVAAIIAIAQKLDIKLVAEGVELREQGELLTSQGCYFAQGFYYYKPMKLEDLRGLLKK